MSHYDDPGRQNDHSESQVDVQLRQDVGDISTQRPDLLVSVLSSLSRSITLETRNYLKFLEDFRALQDSKNPDARLMYAFVRRALRAYHLEGSYREAYVLNEALLRGVQKIREGKLIHNSEAWLRSTCWNIVRELSREQKKTIPLEETIEVEQPAAPSEGLEDNQIIAGQAYRLLDEMEQRLLTLKIVEDRPWSEIREILRAEGHGDHQLSSLRKRKERALTKLRKQFYALQPSD